MKKRYQVGFDEGVRCVLVDDHPDMIPIVDTNCFGFGEVIAFAVDNLQAKHIVNSLNMMEVLKKTWRAD